mgnify:CR=1 FL=1
MGDKLWRAVYDRFHKPQTDPEKKKENFIATVRKAWEKDRAKMGEPKAPSNAAGLPQTEAAR